MVNLDETKVLTAEVARTLTLTQDQVFENAANYIVNNLCSNIRAICAQGKNAFPEPANISNRQVSILVEQKFQALGFTVERRENEEDERINEIVVSWEAQL